MDRLRSSLCITNWRVIQVIAVLVGNLIQLDGAFGEVQPVGQQPTEVVKSNTARLTNAAVLLKVAGMDILAYIALPPELWSRIYSSTSLESLKKEIRRRAYVTAVFPDEASEIRLVGSVLIEIADK